MLRAFIIICLIFGSILIIPLAIGLGGAMIGVVAGLFGAVLGVLGALLGALIAIPAAIMGIFFEGIHIAGISSGLTQIVLLAVLFLAVYMAFRKKNPAKQDP